MVDRTDSGDTCDCERTETSGLSGFEMMLHDPSKVRQRLACLRGALI